MKETSIGINDDYAILRAGTSQFYYGYEHTVGVGDNEEWAFVYSEEGESDVIIGKSQIESRLKPYESLDEPVEYLLHGMAMILEARASE